MNRDLLDLHRGAREERRNLVPDVGPCEPQENDRPECPNCGGPVPEDDRRWLNLGVSSGYCSLICLLEDDDA